MIKRLDNFLMVKPGRDSRLDGVRAIAIILVVLIHTQVHGTIPADIPLFPRILSMFGWVGVPLFFVLSGYLVGGGICAAMASRSFSFRRFYLNRTLRIFPAAYAFLLLSSWPRIGWNVSTLLNFSYLVNYFKEYAFQGNFYSLCIEEHFYLFFPLLLLLLMRYFRVSTRAHIAAMAIIGVLLVSLIRARLALVPTLPPVDFQDIFRMTHTNLDFLFYGILAYVVVQGGWIRPVGWLGGAYPILLASAYLPLALVQWNTNAGAARGQFLAYYYPLVAIWAFAFVVLALTQGGWFARLLGHAVFRWIAVLSYSIYLWNEVVMDWPWYHQLLDASRDFLTNRWIAYAFFLFCDFLVMAFVGLLSFAAIERPFLKLRERLLAAPQSAPRASAVRARQPLELWFGRSALTLGALAGLSQAGHFYAVAVDPAAISSAVSARIDQAGAWGAQVVDFATYHAKFLSFAHYGPVEANVTFPADRIGTVEALLTTGSRGANDELYAFYTNAHQIQFGMAGARYRSPLSDPIPVTYGSVHRIVVTLGSLYPPAGSLRWYGLSGAEAGYLKRRLSVEIDGRPAFSSQSYFSEGAPGDVHWGNDPIAPAYFGGPFTGQISDVKRLPIRAPATLPSVTYGAVRLQLKFPSNRMSQSEPLVVAGVPEAGDLFFVTYLDSHHIRFGLDDWGRGEILSPSLSCDYSAPHVVTLSMGSLYPPASDRYFNSMPRATRSRLKDYVVILMDGIPVFDGRHESYESSPYGISIGQNAIGGSTCGYAFSGTIAEYRRVALDPARP